jgi:CDP-diacylglycerol--glycerol-3-phosphate 3-phosphatidyltransferase
VLDGASARVLVLGLVALAASSGRLGVAFLLPAVPVWLLVAGTLARLRATERDGGPLGAATSVTVLRGWMVSALAGFVALRPETALVRWAPAALYTAAALCDGLDGYVARRRGEVSAVGARLDVALDALGLIVAPLVAIRLGRLPPWYLLLSLAYYLFEGGLWLRARRGLPVHRERLRPSGHSRVFAGLQMGFVATVLYPVLGPPATSIAATLFMVPTMALFTRDWLVGSGRLDPVDPRALAFIARMEQLLYAELPLPLRVVAAAGVGVLVAQGRLAAGMLAPALLVLVGLVTRLAAFLASVWLALLLAQDAGAIPLVTFFSTVTLLLIGGGRAALWSPEERIFLRRAGFRSAPAGSAGATS